MSYPKVLIISHNSFSDTQNNGKTLSSFFAQWPPDKLAQLYFWPEDPDMTVCKNFYRITDYEVLDAVIRLKKAKGKTYKESNVVHQHELGSIVKNLYGNKGNHDGGKGLHYLIHCMFKKRMPIALLSRDLFWNTNVWKTNEIKAWIDSFSPDIVFYQGSNGIFAYKIAIWIAESWEIPILVQITDDYVTPRMLMSPFGWIHHLSLKKIFSHTIKKAFCVFVIGSKMKNEYQRRFDGKYEVLMNCVDKDNSKLVKFITNRDKIRFIYAGSLHTNRWKTLMIIGKCLQELYNEGIESEFLIFCPIEPRLKEIKAITLPPVMQYCGSLKKEELNEQFYNADVLVHIEAFDRNSKHITRLSISTKIPEYLSTGVCVLAVGPQDVASIQYLSDSQTGITITTNNAKIIKKSLKQIILNKELRESLKENAIELTKIRHDASVNRKKIEEIIFNASMKRKPQLT
jgi:glycosyltransferase involved in cell wall biosynthesis